MDLESDPKNLSPFYKDVLALLEAIHERVYEQNAMHTEAACAENLQWEVARIALSSGLPGPAADGKGSWEPFAASDQVVFWRRRVRTAR